MPAIRSAAKGVQAGPGVADQGEADQGVADQGVADPGADSDSDSDPVPAERPVFRGHAALKRLAARATWMYLGAGGLALVVHGGPHPPELIGLLALLVGTGCLVVAACRWARLDLLVLTLVVDTLLAAAVVRVSYDEGWRTPTMLTITIAAGSSVGLALGRRPFAGLLAAALAGAGMSVAASWVGVPVQPLVLLGLPTSTIVASCIALLAGRGFVDTELALRGVDDALAMQRVASARWRAGRRADRDLHDTVLTTLTVLSHPEFDVAAEPIRELARRDLAFLAQNSWRSAGQGRPGEPPGTPPGGIPADRPDQWAQAGLEVSRLGQVEQLAALDPLAGSAVDAAVRQCLSNVARHAGVSTVEVVVNREADNVVVLVVDQGRGFDPAQVPDDRLGLAESVRGRIADVGGSVTVWSRPGAGTTVMLSVPVAAG